MDCHDCLVSVLSDFLTATLSFQNKHRRSVQPVSVKEKYIAARVQRRALDAIYWSLRLFVLNFSLISDASTHP